MIELCCEYLSVRCLYIFIMSRTSLRVNTHSTVLPECQGTPCSKQASYLVRDMIKTYNQMHRTDKYSQHSSIIWPVWLNGWVFVYKLSGCGFESRCSHLIFRYGACFEQGVPWHSGKTVECRFTLKLARDMIKTYNQIFILRLKLLPRKCVTYVLGCSFIKICSLAGF